MHSHWKIYQTDASGLGQCEDFQNNCEKCGKLYRYNWRRRRTRDKTCNLCVSEIKCNATAVDLGEKQFSSASEMTQNGKSFEDNFYIERTTRNSVPATFQYSEPKEDSDSQNPGRVKMVFAVQDFTDQLFCEMKMEFAEELKNPQKPLRLDFDWPTTDQLNKVDCLRAFNIMKQVLLQEMSLCDEVAPTNDPLAPRRKFYLERRFRSLEREKIRRLKVYESLYIREEAKGGL